MAQMDALALEAAEEVFGHGVVIGIALAGHALPDAAAGETLTVSVGGVLDAAVGVEDAYSIYGNPGFCSGDIKGTYRITA